MIHTFEATEHLSLENSFGTLKEAVVKLQVSVRINEKDAGKDADGSPRYTYAGSFEMYDDETGGDEWYAEGGLWFVGKELVDYDGVFALPQCICDFLREHGFDPSYAED
jgi:hypothetical protein